MKQFNVQNSFSLIFLKKYILFATATVFFCANLNSQCPTAPCTLPITWANTPNDACVLSNPILLDGYMGNTAGFGPFSIGNACEYGAHNNQWIAFQSVSETVTFTFTSYNCSIGLGIDMAVFESPTCTFGSYIPVSNCVEQGAPGTTVILAENLEPCKIYIVMVDGFAGDICDWDVEVELGPPLPPPIPPPTPGPISGIIEVCPGASEIYSVNPVLGADDYQWTLIPAIGNLNPNVNFASVDWTSPGTAQLCVTTSNACGMNPVPSCITINSTIIPPTVEEVDLCLGGFTVCAGQTFFAPGFETVTLSSWLGCDSLINCVINLIPPISTNIGQVELCGPDVYELCNSFYSSSGIHTATCTSYQGCDSTVIVDLAIMTPMAAIVQPIPMIDCGGNSTITLDGSGSNLNLVPDGTTSYLWTGPGIVGPDDQDMVMVDQAGEYCLELTHERNGEACTDVLCVEVLEDNATPDPPLLDGPTEVCDGDMENYTVTPIGNVPETGFTWLTPNGEPFTQNGNTITVDWTGSTGGQLCVTADNLCGSSDPPTCIDITVNLGPEDPILDGQENLCDGDVSIYQILNPTVDATYSWTVPAGASFTDNGTSIEVNFAGSASGDICVTGSNLCGMSNEVCLPVTVNNPPNTPVFLSGPMNVCDGISATYCVQPDSEVDDYTWVTPEGTTTNAGDCHTVNWTGLSSGNVCVTANNNCEESTEICMAVTVDESPEAVLSGDEFVCMGSGESVDFTIDLTGTAPWTLVYEIGGNNFTESGIMTSPFSLSATTVGTYSLISVNDATDCDGLVSGTATISENPLPTADLTGSGSICDGSGESVDLIINLTGTPNWTVNWTVDGQPQAALNINTNPFTLTLGQAQAGDIQLTDVTDGNGCTDQISGNISVISIDDAPSVSNININCLSALEYTVSFEVTGGDSGSYSVTSNISGIDGTLSATAPFIFTSDTIPSGDGYSFTVNDANDCNPTLTEDVIVFCECDTEVGTMGQDLIEQCGDDPIFVMYDQTGEFLDPDDLGEFILHEGSGVNIVNPIDTSFSPLFDFLPGMNFGQIYYVSAVVGSNDGGGTVDLNDPCLDVAQGTPVVWYDRPSGIMSGETAVCVGEDVGLQFEFEGIAPWSIMFFDGTDTTTVNGINTSPFTLNITPDSTRTYTLIGVNDNHCEGSSFGAVDVNLNTEVEVSNMNIECDVTSTFYVLTFEISGGDPDSYSVTGLPGTISDSPPYTFTSDPVPNLTGFDLTIDDLNSCNPQNLVQNLVVCECTTEAGVIDLTPIEQCGDAPVTANYDDQNEFLDSDDISQFILHTSSTALGTIIQTNNTDPTFGFDPALMNYGTTYYISAIVGNDDGSGNVDLNDPCFQLTDGKPVTFFDIPTAEIMGNPEICEGGDADLTINLTGDSPWSITINGETINDIVSTPFVYNVAPDVTTTYNLENVSDENCPGTFSGEGTVSVNLAPTITNLTFVCNPTNTAYTVSFEIQGGDNSCYSVNGSPGTLTGNVFVSDEILVANDYLFQIDDCNDCGPLTIDGSYICDCTSDAGFMTGGDLEICGDGTATAEHSGTQFLDADDVLCFILHDGNPNAPIAVNPTEPTFQFQPGLMNYGQTYYICASVGNDNGNGCVSLTDPCRDVSDLCTEVIFHERPTAEILGDASICEGTSTDIMVTFTGGNAPYTFSYDDALTGNVETVTTDQNPFTLSVTPDASTIYSLISVSDENCDGTANGNFPVTLNVAPTTGNFSLLCDDTNTFYTISFTVNSANSNITILPALSGTITPAPPYIFTSNPIPVNQSYYFEVDDGNNCGPTVVSGDPICDCVTEAGSMEDDIVSVCETEMISGIHLGDEILAPNDVLEFVLLENETDTYSQALATNSMPEFSFNCATMTAGIAYWICPAAGPNSGNGSPDPTDDCFIIGECVPVFWQALPTASILGTTSLCEGESANITFNMTGVGPFEVQYLENNVPQTITVFDLDTTFSITPNSTVQYQITGVNDLSLNCSNTAAGIITISVSTPVNAGSANNPDPLCEGEDFTFDLNDFVIGGDPGGQWTNANNSLISNVFQTVNQPSGTHIFTYTVTASAPCPNQSTEIEIVINPTPVADAGESQSLDCNTTVANLGGPNTSQGNFTYEWTGGNVENPNASITTTVESGTYTLLVTDNLTQCTASETVEITLDNSAPQPTLSFSDLSCFNADDGFISLAPITGGSPPYECSLNGGPFSDESVFLNLSAGEYIIICRDSKGCETEIPISITQPDELEVEITGEFDNDENLVQLGDSVLISLEINLPFDSLDAVIWTPNEAVPCDTCETFYITPFNQLTLSVSVQEGQCTDDDELTIFVRKNRPVYIPNAFSPNGDGVNDRFFIQSGPGITEIKTFLILSRWGETIFEAKNFQPNNPDFGWDGTHRGEVLNPEVFVWFAEVEFIDGAVKVFEGDVTLVK